jgi:excisionase family DNA binding protein
MSKLLIDGSGDSRASQFFENLISVDDLAGMLRLAPQTIRNWVAQRKLPYIRVGRRTMFRRKSIEAWLDRKESKPCP